MTDSLPELPELPEGWTIATIADVVEASQYGTSTKADADESHGIPMLRMSNIQDGRLDLSDLKYVGRSRELESVLVAPGDVLFNRTNSPELVGKAAVVDVDREMVFASYLIRLRVRPDVIHSTYLCWWINSAWGREWAARVRTDGVSQSNINGTKLAAMPIPLPPIAEQRRIVQEGTASRNEAARAKARLDRVSQILKRFRRAVLAAACSGELTREWRRSAALTDARAVATGDATNDREDYDAHFEQLDLPEGWARARVDTLVAIQNGRPFPSKEYTAHGARLLRPGNLHSSGRVTWTDENTVCMPMAWMQEAADFVLGQNELVMNLTAQSLKDEFLGRVCMKNDNDPALLNQRIARFTPLGTFDTRQFLFLHFKSRFFRTFVDGLDTGSLIRHMHSKDVARYVVPLPPPEEQSEIVRRANELLKLADAIESHGRIAASRADKLPPSILAKAFSGELVPTEAELARAEGRAYETADQLLARVRREGTDGERDSHTRVTTKTTKSASEPQRRKRRRTGT